MDPRTGDIYEIISGDEKKMIENKLGRKLVDLTNEQAKILIPLSKRRRKALLAGMSCPCASGKSFKKCCWKRYKQSKIK